MNRESAALALAGVMIGLLALGGVTFARLHPPEPEESAAIPGLGQETAQPASAPEYGAEEPAVPVLAEPEPFDADPTAGPFSVSLRVPDPVRGEKLFVCDALGCPLEEIEPDPDGAALLGPFAPGSYSVQRGQTEVAAFRLLDNAALCETSGRLWTDGELLWLERFTPGTLRLSVTLHGTGYYTMELRDRVGRVWNRDLYVPDGTPPDADGLWRRVLDFQGLPPGLYTAVRQNRPLGQTEVSAEAIAELAIEIEK